MRGGFSASHCFLQGGYMPALKFYHVSEKYIRYLNSFDLKVQYNKGQRRPYVGIVLSVNDIDYFVPLESPKPNHKNIKSGGPVMKLDDGKLGIMGFNNMIPVAPSSLIEFDILAVEDEKYKALLLNQLQFCRKNRKLICDRADKVYKKRTQDKNTFYISCCCDFKKLEKACKRYNPAYKKKKVTKTQK